jgi:hypothetical protein
MLSYPKQAQVSKCEQCLSVGKEARDGHGEVLVEATSTMGLGVKGASIENTSKALARRWTLPVNARNDRQSDPDFNTTDDTILNKMLASSKRKLIEYKQVDQFPLSTARQRGEQRYSLGIQCRWFGMLPRMRKR